ncbi:hypothetical protein [Tenggerimyces flavus]|uniref:Uncharacterized protein n=1 Tax=Tenggerimyces flavus TaxID=1708749 RepID=A0ABV7Y384_9ACTN|nr:hypothetical protein [Tenggerimyces flavus]MBM7790070.1 hypothetical protein [Tenggerimyces flavus]
MPGDQGAVDVPDQAVAAAVAAAAYLRVLVPAKIDVVPVRTTWMPRVAQLTPFSLCRR